MTVDERTSVLHTVRSAAHPVPAHLVDELPTTTLAVVGAPPVFVDDSGRRRRTLAGVGSAVAALCVLYLCVVVLGVLRGADNPLLGGVGGLLPAAAEPEAGTPAAPPAAAPVPGAPAAGTGPARTAGTRIPTDLVPTPAPLVAPVVAVVPEVAAPSAPVAGTRPPRTRQSPEPERGNGNPVTGGDGELNPPGGTDDSPAPEETGPVTDDGTQEPPAGETGTDGTEPGEPGTGTGSEGTVPATEPPAGTTR